VDGSGTRVSQRLSTRPEPALAAPSDARVAAGRAGQRALDRLITAPLWIAAGDALALFAAFVLAYAVRYVWHIGPELNEFQAAPLEAYWIVASLFVPVTLLSFAALGRYQRRRVVPLVDDARRVILGALLGTAVVIVVFFVSRPFFFSRLMFLYLFAFSAAAACVWLLVRRAGIGALRRAGYDNQRVLVAGNGVVAKYLMQQLSSSPSAGHRVVGYLASVADGNPPAEAFGRFRRLGDLSDLETIINTSEIDDVYIALPSHEQHNLGDTVERCQRQGVRFLVVPDLLEAHFGKFEFFPVAGIPLITLSDTSIEGFKFVQKRALDVLVSGLALAVAAPLWLVLAISIRLDSAGPVLFRQQRIGRNGRAFTVLKFRSMVHDAEAHKAELFNGARHPLLFKDPHDRRRTRVGRVIRRFSLDELPQLLNVLLGDMSLVGPRAQVPDEVAQYDAWARHRLRALPGLTGLWQVSGRSDLPFEEMVMLDTYYIGNWSLGLDLHILARTIPAVIFGRGAY